MTSKIAYRTRCKLLFGFFIVILYVTYKVSFQQTLINRNEVANNLEKIKRFKDKEAELTLVKESVKTNELGNYDDGVPFRDQLANFISLYSDKNDCILVNIPPGHIYRKSGASIETNIFTIKGNFLTLLSLQNEIERKFKYRSKVAYVHYYTIQNAKKKELNVTMSIQSFNTNANETI